MAARVEGFGCDVAIGTEADLFNFFLRLAKFRFAMALQLGAALVGLDRPVELAVAGFERRDDLLELFERVLEAHLPDFLVALGASHVTISAEGRPRV